MRVKNFRQKNCIYLKITIQRWVLEKLVVVSIKICLLILQALVNETRLM